MSDDEVFVFIIALCVSIPFWIGWYIRFGRVTELVSSLRDRLALFLAPPLSVIGIYIVLRLGGSHDVRNAPVYLIFYTVLGAAWLGTFWVGVPLLGLSGRDDVIERHNQAVAIAISGALIGIAATYAGGNIGEGPGWWVVVFAAGLATITLFAGWLILELLTHIAATITIDRDVAAGWRLGGYLVAGGLILGRAVAGNWVSVSGTLVDFVHYGWPFAVLTLLAIGVERLCRPTVAHPLPAIPQFGIAPAMVFLVGAIGLLLWSGL